MKKYILFVLIFTVLLVTGCKEPEPVTLVDFGDSGIKLYSDWEWYREGEYTSHRSDYIKVNGTIINTGEKKYQYLELWAHFYDDEGYVIQKDFTNFVDVYPGEKRSFEIISYIPRAKIKNVELFLKH